MNHNMTATFKKHMRRIAWAALVIVLALFATGCSQNREHQARVEAAAPAVSVTTQVVTQTEWPSFYEAPGTVRARTSTPISARLMAAVREIRVHAGDHVRAGQVLVTLDA